MADIQETGYLEATPGNKSVKRLLMVIIFSLAIILSIFVVIWDALHIGVDLPAGFPILCLMYITGLFLAGFITIENIIGIVKAVRGKDE